jgi:hypothetical protein
LILATQRFSRQAEQARSLPSYRRSEFPFLGGPVKVFGVSIYRPLLSLIGNLPKFFNRVFLGHGSFCGF